MARPKTGQVSIAAGKVADSCQSADAFYRQMIGDKPIDLATVNLWRTTYLREIEEGIDELDTALALPD